MPLNITNQNQEKLMKIKSSIKVIINLHLKQEMSKH